MTMATTNEFQRPQTSPEGAQEIPTEDARQGTTGHNVRYVLAASLVLSLVALYIAWTYI
jgi:hypothetical protein